MSQPVSWSKTVTFFEGAWHDGNVPIMGPRTHAAWLGTSVFDGARAFEGVTPDLDLHCARINKSAEVMCLKAVVPAETWMDLVHEGLKRFLVPMPSFISGRCTGRRRVRLAGCGRTRSQHDGV